MVREKITLNPERNTNPSVKEIFKPTLLKCFLPVLVFILIAISFFVNSSHLQPASENLCDYLTNALTNTGEFTNLEELAREKRLEYNSNPQEIINLYQQIDDLDNEEQISRDNLLLKHIKPVVNANLYLTFSGVYRLNPLFPIPCETFASPLGLKNSRSCKYYISEEAYNCINSFSHPESENSAASIISLFGVEALPEYNKISFGVLLINGIILALIIYLIVCIIYFFNVKLYQFYSQYYYLYYSLIILTLLFYLLILS
jgi:hypothetical protein